MKTTNHRESIGGKPIINATRKVKVHIEPKDIKGGKNKDPGACAAARALLREIPNCVAARVHLGRTYLLNNKGNWLRYKTPEALRGEIIAFDRGGSFQPGEYELRPVAPSEMSPKKKTPPSPGRDGPGNDPNKSPRKLHVTAGVRKRGANR